MGMFFYLKVMAYIQLSPAKDGLQITGFTYKTGIWSFQKQIDALFRANLYLSSMCSNSRYTLRVHNWGKNG
jgi:hypothetical protein